MTRRQYLVAYDIADDKRRTRVFTTLMGQGDHIQYSVFLCALNPKELAVLRARLEESIHSRDDQVIIIDLGRADSDPVSLVQCLGKRYIPTSRVQVI